VGAWWGLIEDWKWRIGAWRLGSLFNAPWHDDEGESGGGGDDGVVRAAPVEAGGVGEDGSEE